MTGASTGLSREYVRDTVAFLALRPGETLVVKLPAEGPAAEAAVDVRDQLRDALEGTGIKGLVVIGDAEVRGG